MMLPRVDLSAAIAAALYGAVALASQNVDVLSYVNPLIGTSRGGGIGEFSLPIISSWLRKSLLQGTSSQGPRCLLEWPKLSPTR